MQVGGVFKAEQSKVDVINKNHRTHDLTLRKDSPSNIPTTLETMCAFPRNDQHDLNPIDHLRRHLNVAGIAAKGAYVCAYVNLSATALFVVM